MNKWSRTIVTALTLSGLPVASYAEEVNACQKEQYEQFLQARLTWQSSLLDMINESQPRFTQTARSYNEEQVLIIEANRLEFEYLLKYKPNKIHPGETLNKWLELSEEDKQALAQENTRYREILDKTTFTDAVRKQRTAAFDSMRRVTMDSPQFYVISKEHSTRLQKLQQHCGSESAHSNTDNESNGQS